MQTFWTCFISWIAINPLLGIAAGKFLKGRLHVPG